MNHEEFLEKIGLERLIKSLHETITQEFPTNNPDLKFDAWYTKRDFVLNRLCSMGGDIAKQYKEESQFGWSKFDVSAENQKTMVEELTKMGAQPNVWEHAPDGTLFGIAILLSGWLANQTSNKSADNTSDSAAYFFDKDFKFLVDAAIKIGKRRVKAADSALVL